MILLGVLIGAALGAWRARSAGGGRLDLLQWAAVGAILGGLLGLFLLIAITRATA
jgi:uncharacterized protein YqgC (DUF456 family)